jgi:membrane-associated PAP2 superfamily phosphatase
MKTLERYGWTKKAAFLVMLLMLLSTSIVLLTPAKAYACCGWRIVERYYSDASYTTQVGTCIEDECAGTYTCSGDVSGNFIRATQTCCDHCLQ